MQSDMNTYKDKQTQPFRMSIFIKIHSNFVIISGNSIFNAL